MEKKPWISPRGEEVLIRVIAWLKQGAPTLVNLNINGFNMCVGIEYDPAHPDCGTTCCMAGAVCQFDKPFDIAAIAATRLQFPELKQEIGWWGHEDSSVFGRAMNILGIEEEIAEELFQPADGFPDAGDITAKFAASVAEHFLLTGKVDWTHTAED